MRKTRVNLALSQAMLKDLDKLAARYGFDRTNAIRYCIRFTCDAANRSAGEADAGGDKKDNNRDY